METANTGILRAKKSLKENCKMTDLAYNQPKDNNYSLGNFPLCGPHEDPNDYEERLKIYFCKKKD